jgi:hypothetical protein
VRFFRRPLNRSGTTIQKGPGFLAESKHYHPILGFVSSRVKRVSIVNLAEVPSQLTSLPGREADKGNLKLEYA